jgi:hypothetical protein
MEAVTVALVTAVGGIIVAAIHSFRKENHKDHAAVMDAIDRVSNTVERVEGKVDSHIQWHAQGGTSGATIRRDKDGSRKKSRSSK